MAWYSDNPYEKAVMVNRMGGPFAVQYWALILCNVLTPQLLWFKKVRFNPGMLFVLALIINTGMWLERYVITVVSLSRDFLPSSWGRYAGTPWDWAMYVGTLGLFFALLFLFIRFLPMISIFEMRTLLPEAHVHAPTDKGAPAVLTPGAREGRK
jgi:hypothetical protein